ncbi:MAG: aldolase/citrate lyase family protein [bacterium]|nr:aldolase/citrate lyase family protein [bacterium]
MKENKLRRLLREGKPTLGTHVLSPWPGLIEVIGRTGMFDYIEFLGEYASWSFEGLDNIVRAAELHGTSIMFKVEEQNRGQIATRAVDAGCEALLFADCRSVKEVEECIALVRPETPQDHGVHGCGLRRGVCHDLTISSSDEWLQAMRDIVIAIQIEKKGAIENLEAILKVPGVDIVQFGCGDYSITVGKQRNEVKDEEKRMIETALKMGVLPRAEVFKSEDALPYLKLGVRHFCDGFDMDIVKQYCLIHVAEMRKLLKI